MRFTGALLALLTAAAAGLPAKASEVRSNGNDTVANYMREARPVFGRALGRAVAHCKTKSRDLHTPPIRVAYWFDAEGKSAEVTSSMELTPRLQCVADRMAAVSLPRPPSQALNANGRFHFEMEFRPDGD